jgi:hypothetical protein
MATRIAFSGVEGDGLRVDEDPAQIYSVVSGTANPIELHHDGKTVYVNPARIAYWTEAPSRQVSF